MSTLHVEMLNQICEFCDPHTRARVAITCSSMYYTLSNQTFLKQYAAHMRTVRDIDAIKHTIIGKGYISTRSYGLHRAGYVLLSDYSAGVYEFEAITYDIGKFCKALSFETYYNSEAQSVVEYTSSVSDYNPGMLMWIITHLV
jgi:hypothetical protein